MDERHRDDVQDDIIFFFFNSPERLNLKHYKEHFLEDQKRYNHSFGKMTKLVHNVQKKQHRERSQPQERARLGLLEKKKDYRLRAADYHKKQAALKALRKKATYHNPDEYYHSMTRNKADNRGILIADRGNEALSVEQVKLLKSQDANYIRTMRLNESLKIRKQKEDLNFKANGKHTVFVDSFEEQKNFKPEEYFQTDKSMLKRRENRLKLDQLESNERIVDDGLFDNPIIKEREDLKKLKKFKLLKSRMDRERQLGEVESKMEMTKELMKKGNKKKITDKNGNIQFKWKNQRKR
ncbi:uncharacterized protein PRCAT00005857001 [Priceomyces carsonii]|uniref:uncharacterized protein n=1 Tax=Priceomyces carsonii TaxID=28549 RepID=UPI002ED90C6A|nr:unnamed protein product [Priceomyces carsonii]